MTSRRAVILGFLALLLFYLPGCGGGGGSSAADLSTSTVVWQEVARGQYLVTITVSNTGGKTANNITITLQLFQNGVFMGSESFFLGSVAAGQTQVFQDTQPGPPGATQIRYELSWE